MSQSGRDPITVYSFGPAWGTPFPTVSPFGLKLVVWLKLYDLPFELKIENNPGKGPKGKCPWVVLDGAAIGDSEIIIERLKARAGRDLDAALTPGQKATALAVRRMFDEHYHQTWEHQLFIDEAAWQIGKVFFDQLPPGVRVLVRTLARSGLKKQLHARGVGRHDDADIIRMGIADLDAADALLGDQQFFFGDKPTDLDATAYAFLGLTHYVPSPSPMFAHLRKLPRLGAYCERMTARYFAAG